MLENITLRTDKLLTIEQLIKIHESGWKLSITIDDFDVYPLEFIHGAMIHEISYLYLLTELGLERLGRNVPYESLGARMDMYGLKLDNRLISIAGRIIGELDMLSRYVDLHPKLNIIPEGILKILPDNFHILSDNRYARVEDINKASLLGQDTTFNNNKLWGTN